jgi:hypothetical protein
MQYRVLPISRVLEPATVARLDRRFSTSKLLSLFFLCASILWQFLFPCAMNAKVTRIVLEKGSSTPWALEGKSFGDIGTYQRIQGIAYGELDPNDSHNSLITDIVSAPRNARGAVEYAATFTLLIPTDKRRWSKVLVYEVVNRGASIEPKRFESGDAFLTSGWQGDLPFGGASIYGGPGETIKVPIAHKPDGGSLTGPILARFMNIAPGLNTLYLRSAIGYATSGPAPTPLNLDTSKARLTKIPFETGTGLTDGSQLIDPKDWAWGDCTSQPFPGKPASDKICLKGSFNPLLVYQLEYTGKDPLVLGIGLAAIRDVVTFFKSSQHDDSGWKNPLSGSGKVTAIGRGASQAGNTLRTFINLGFNQAEDGNIVFEGAMPVIASRQNPINFRFAVPGGASGLQELGSDGVVWWSHWPDELRGNPAGGLLDRCTASGTCPKIFEVLGSSEFWALRATPDFVGTSGKQDVPLPENVRRYYVASKQHGGGGGGFRTEIGSHSTSPRKVSSADPVLTMPCVFAPNPNPMGQITKALLVGLERWVLQGVPPPRSVYPSLAEHTLAPANAADLGYPSSPILPRPDGLANPLLVYDLGPEFHDNDLSGIVLSRPSPIIGMMPPMAPTVDSDGNEIGGIHTVLQQAALGTYLGWNVTASGFQKGQLCALSGSFIPFAPTKAVRTVGGDARLSLEERYGTQRGYVCAVAKASAGLQAEGFLLAEDAEALRHSASESKVLPSDNDSSPDARKTADNVCRDR